VERAIAVADLTKLVDRVFTELSGGEQRRVLVARALATEARVLLFDEPTASLDVRHGLALYRLATEQVAAGVAVIMVLHQLADALRYADHALLLHEGRAVHAGRPSDVITDATVREVYAVRMVSNAMPGFDMP
jgi:iron complex transport system ATP-binding protein